MQVRRKTRRLATSGSGYAASPRRKYHMDLEPPLLVIRTTGRGGSFYALCHLSMVAVFAPLLL
jgi:hypothetical protein